MIHKVLTKIFGYKSFRSRQEDIIKSVLNGFDTIGILPTGTGKSICYQIPGIIAKGTTLVVSPLKALMLDQKRSLDKIGVRSEFLNSSQSPEDAQLIKQELLEGKIKFLFVSPERLSSEGFQNFLKKIKISFIAIDEAHCIVQFGGSFRSEYKKLGFLKEKFGVPILALTATANDESIKIISEELKLEDPEIIKTSVNRPNIKYSVENKKGAISKIIKKIKKVKNGTSIIYCATRKHVETVTEELEKSGINVKKYHGGLEDEKREEIQNNFSNGKIKVIVATIAFGMGIDKSDIRLVIHYDIPQSISAYSQEVGRAGRDGKKSDAILFYSKKDLDTINFLINTEKDEKLLEKKKSEFKLMRKLVTSGDCIREQLSEYFNMKEISEVCTCSSFLRPNGCLFGNKRKVNNLKNINYSFEKTNKKNNLNNKKTEIKHNNKNFKRGFNKVCDFRGAGYHDPKTVVRNMFDNDKKII